MDLLSGLLLSGVLQFGLIPGHSMAEYGQVDQMTILDAQHTVFVDYQATARYGMLFVTGGFTSYSLPARQGVDFYPFRADYVYGAGLRRGPIELGYSHGCYHPIAPNMVIYPLPKIDSGYDQFYIKIKMGKE
jgi:hypothetical protein